MMFFENFYKYLKKNTYTIMNKNYKKKNIINVKIYNIYLFYY